VFEVVAVQYVEAGVTPEAEDQPTVSWPHEHGVLRASSWGEARPNGSI
jgi:hypothetical protein